MTEREKVIAQITKAFAAVEYPGDWKLRDSNVGNEPYLLEQEFRGMRDWRVLAPKFLDRAPDGYGSALHFFSHQALHFYLPAYLIADIQGLLERSDPVFSLTHSFVNSRKNEQINPRLYGEQTWFEYGQERFAIFSHDQAAAIVAYLNLMRGLNEYNRQSIDEALENYWREKAM
jgi:hypothetical protein